jgi:hypothetical protein
MQYLPGILWGLMALIALLLLGNSTVLPFIYSLF